MQNSGMHLGQKTAPKRFFSEPQNNFCCLKKIFRSVSKKFGKFERSFGRVNKRHYSPPLRNKNVRVRQDCRKTLKFLRAIFNISWASDNIGQEKICCRKCKINKYI